MGVNLLHRFFIGIFRRFKFMSKFYSLLLDDEMHNALRKKSFETKEPISTLVRKGINFVLTTNNGKCKNVNNNDN